MATIFAKTYTIPTIAAVRATCKGEQYTVQTPEYIDIVTVNGSQVTCTCGECSCSHIQAVTRRRAVEQAQDTRRAAYAATFDLSYGDAA
ncbi:MAG: hypothetical protein ACRDHW_13360 [Ktedonobacteraceae bacterium]